MAEKQTKFIFVTGGVVSGLGKGITAASLGRLLKCRGLKVASQKPVSYTHLKHDGFVSPVGDGTAIMEFSGKELVRGEPDARCV